MAAWEKIVEAPDRHRIPRYAEGRRMGRMPVLRREGVVPSPFVELKGSQHAAALAARCLSDAQAASREELWVVFLDDCRACGVTLLARGEAGRVGIHLSALLRKAMLSGCRSFLLAHNHPSGDPRPSVGDWLATVRMVEASVELGYEVVDHLVVAGDRYASLRELNEGVFEVGRAVVPSGTLIGVGVSVP